MEIEYNLPPVIRGQMFSVLSSQEVDWWHDQFHMEAVWKKSQGAGIRVAVLDTGIDTDHPDLDGQILSAKDFTNSRSGPEDVNKHGTHVAGTIAAVNNDVGVQGVAWGLSNPIKSRGTEKRPKGGILSAKVLGDNGSGSSSMIVRGIEWAVSNEAQVINMSLGSAQRDDRIIGAIKEAIASGVVVCVAAGNSGQAGVDWPGRMEEALTVAAIDSRGKPGSFSARGPQVNVAAPGVQILSTIPGGRYQRMTGTSMATPFVAGCCALLMSSSWKNPLSPSDVMRQILSTAKEAGPPGKDTSYGSGIVAPSEFLRDESPDPPARDGFSVGPLYLKFAEIDGRAGFFVGVNESEG